MANRVGRKPKIVEELRNYKAVATLNNLEQKKLDKICSDWGLGMSAMIRKLIDDEYKRLHDQRVLKIG